MPTAGDGEQLEVKDVIVDFSTMHYGMKEKNPLDFVKFYSKRSPNGMCSICCLVLPFNFL